MSESRSIEISATDVESAISKGVSELGVSRDDVMVEIIEEPGRRLLGLGTRQARVRLTVIRAPHTPEVSRPAPATPSVTASKPAPAAAKPDKPVTAKVQPPPPAAATEDEDEGEEPDAIYDEDEEDWKDTRISVSEADLVEDAKIGAETLQTLLDYMKIQAKVAVKQSETDGNEAQHWTLEIQGRDLGALIGRKGETLAALQYITRLITSRDLERRANIVIDVEGYKSRREVMLKRLAKRMAEQAIQRGRTVSLEPMPPHERRIIHLTLRDNPNVTTESVGEGDRRKVTIVPRRAK